MGWTPASGELIAERFLLEHELARGGMGSVWVAHHITLDTPCAVKFIEDQLADEASLRERFEREARASAKLRSRHVVQVLDYGVWNDVPYLTMELLEGESLADRLEKRSRLEPLELLTILHGVVRALSKAQRLGIVHRDIKPENIFLVSEGEGEYAKVLDFGIAKLRESDPLRRRGKTKTGAVMGTPYYMSPEQVDGTKDVDHRADLWSLAVIVFECLTGELPFYSEAFGNLVMQITGKPLPRLSDVVPELPAAIDAWWLKAAARNPDDRFQSSDELFAALEQALMRADGIAISALPPPSLSSWRPPAMREALGSEPDVDSLLPGWSGPNSSARPPDSGIPTPSDPPRAARDSRVTPMGTLMLDGSAQTLSGHTAISSRAASGRGMRIALVSALLALAAGAWLTRRMADETAERATTVTSPSVAALPPPGVEPTSAELPLPASAVPPPTASASVTASARPVVVAPTAAPRRLPPPRSRGLRDGRPDPGY